MSIDKGYFVDPSFQCEVFYDCLIPILQIKHFDSKTVYNIQILCKFEGLYYNIIFIEKKYKKIDNWNLYLYIYLTIYM